MRKLGRRAFLLSAAGTSALAVMPRVASANTYTALRDQVFTLAGSKYAQSNSRITSQTAYPSQTPSPTGPWNTTNSSAWTCGFYHGSLWHLYEWSKNATWKTIAQSREA